MSKLIEQILEEITKDSYFLVHSIDDIKRHLDRSRAYLEISNKIDGSEEEKALAHKASIIAFCRAADVFGKVLDKDYEPKASIMVRALFGCPEEAPKEPEPN